MDALNPDALTGDGTFASNRATGDIALAVASVGGASRRARVHEAGSLRVRFPNAHGAGALEAVIVNTGGGMTGGDRFSIDIDVGAGASLTVTTAAAEKIYRSLGPDTEISMKLAVDAGALLAWLPQETIVFDRARLRRSIEVDLAPDANLLLGEAVVFGRTAMDEMVTDGSLFDRWRVRVDGALIFAETIKLDGAIAHRLAKTAIAADGAAIASVLKIPGDDDAVAAIRVLAPGFAGEVGVSCWNGLALARLVATDGAALRRDLAAVLPAWGADPLPRLWVN
jgi:urease accessory protein